MLPFFHFNLSRALIFGIAIGVVLGTLVRTILHS